MCVTCDEQKIAVSVHSGKIRLQATNRIANFVGKPELRLSATLLFLSEIGCTRLLPAVTAAAVYNRDGSAYLRMHDTWGHPSKV